MKNYDYGYGFKPISPWGYVGYTLLWSIPVVGWIVWLCAAIGSKKRNVRNYARSLFCGFILFVLVNAAIVGAAFLLNHFEILTFETMIAKAEELLKIKFNV